jgi:hypothetical protein
MHKMETAKGYSTGLCQMKIVTAGTSYIIYILPSINDHASHKRITTEALSSLSDGKSKVIKMILFLSEDSGCFDRLHARVSLLMIMSSSTLGHR